MEEQDNIISGWKRRKKPDVPNDFFDQFIEDLMLRIESESGVLGQLKKSKKPEVPEGFFDNLLSESISETKNVPLLIDQLNKRSKPALPGGYFDEFEDQLMEKINDDGKKGRIIPLRIFAVVASVAAVLAITFSIIHVNNDLPNSYVNSVGGETSEIDTTTSAVIYNNYMAYMDEAELIDYIIENDIEIKDTTTVNYDDYSEFSEDELLDYYLDL